MTSYEFEKICKNQIIDQIKKIYKKDINISRLQIVWFSRVLENYKCLIMDKEQKGAYFECTYSGKKGSLFIDIYRKQHNIEISLKKEGK